MSDTEDRRKNDEAFRMSIVEKIAELKTMTKSIEDHLGKVDDSLTQNALKITEINYLLLGGPRKDDIGLMESFRSLARKWAIAITILGVIAQGVGFVLKEAVKKFINMPVYTAPAKPKKVVRFE